MWLSSVGGRAAFGSFLTSSTFPSFCGEPCPNTTSGLLSRRFDLKTLPVDFVECLMRFLPTENEVKVLRLYERERKPIENLSDEDRFMMQFSKIERLMQKMTIMAFIGNFAESIQMLTPVSEGQPLGTPGGECIGCAGIRASLGFRLPLGAVLCGAGQLAGSTAVMRRCGPGGEGYRVFNFAKTERWFECCGVIISSHGDRTRNNYTNEKVVFKLYFHISTTLISQVLFVPWTAPYRPISLPCRSLKPV